MPARTPQLLGAEHVLVHDVTAEPLARSNRHRFHRLSLSFLQSASCCNNLARVLDPGSFSGNIAKSSSDSLRYSPTLTAGKPESRELRMIITRKDADLVFENICARTHQKSKMVSPLGFDAIRSPEGIGLKVRKFNSNGHGR